MIASTGVLPESAFDAFCVKASAEYRTKTIGDGIYALWSGNEQYPYVQVIGSGPMYNYPGNPDVGYRRFYFYEDTHGIEFQDGITLIAYRAFCNLKHLNFVIIPKSVKSIGEEAFLGCTGVRDVYYQGSKEEWRSIEGVAKTNLSPSCIMHYNSNYTGFPVDVKLGIYSDTFKQDYNIDFTYNDSLFIDYDTDDSRIFNYDLSKLSSVMAQAAYPKNGSMNNDYVKENLNRLGFEHIDDMGSYAKIEKMHNDKKSTYYHYVGYTFAHRKLIDGKEVIAVIIKGTSGNEEWMSDFDVGKDNADEGNRHYGFNTACQSLEKDLNSYMKKNGFVLSKTKIWITGHSRGAAVGNLLAGDLNDIAINKTVNNNNIQWLDRFKELKPENIYAYLFAVPSVVVDRDCSVQVRDLEDDTSPYSNIYNYVNPQDFVTYMPLPQWGYAKYGKLLTIPNDSNKEIENENNIFYKFHNNFYDCLEDLFKTNKVNFYVHGTETTLNITDKLYSLAKNVSEYYGETRYEIGIPLPESVNKILKRWNPYYNDNIEIGFSPYLFFYSGLAKIMSMKDADAVKKVWVLF